MKENCKPLKVSFWLPLAQRMQRAPRHWADTAEARQLEMAASFRLWEAVPKAVRCWQ